MVVYERRLYHVVTVKLDALPDTEEYDTTRRTRGKARQAVSGDFKEDDKLGGRECTVLVGL